MEDLVTLGLSDDYFKLLNEILYQLEHRQGLVTNHQTKLLAIFLGITDLSKYDGDIVSDTVNILMNIHHNTKKSFNWL